MGEKIPDNNKMLGRIGSNRNINANAKRCSHFEKQLVSFFKIKHNLTIQLSNFTLGIYPSEM